MPSDLILQSNCWGGRRSKPVDRQRFALLGSLNLNSNPNLVSNWAGKQRNSLKSAMYLIFFYGSTSFRNIVYNQILNLIRNFLKIFAAKKYKKRKYFSVLNIFLSEYEYLELSFLKDFWYPIFRKNFFQNFLHTKIKKRKFIFCLLERSS